MKEVDKLDLKALQIKFANFKVKEDIHTYKVRGDEIKNFSYSVYGLPGNTELELIILDDDSANELSRLLSGNINFSTDFFFGSTRQ